MIDLSSLTEGVTVVSSGFSVSARDLVCLLLVVLLLLCSCCSCYLQWRKNYRLPPGHFSPFTLENCEGKIDARD